MSDLAAKISQAVSWHFIDIWVFTLVCAGLIPFFLSRAALARGLESNAPARRLSEKLDNGDLLCLALFALFVAAYIALRLWKDDFASADNDQITEFALRGYAYPTAIWPDSGRMFPLHLQEFNLLMHLTRRPVAFHVFGVLQLIVWALVTIASLPECTIPRRVLAALSIMCTTSFVISFADLIFPERNILFWLAMFILCRRRYSATASPVFLAGTLVSVQFALYYKEPVWLLFAGFAGMRLAVDWKATPGQKRVWRFLKQHPAEFGTMVLSAVFLLLFAAVMFKHDRFVYLTSVRLTLGSTVLRYLKVDLLVFVFLAVFAFRMLRRLRDGGELDAFWDPLAAGAACYALALFGLRIFSGYYMAPVDAVAVLFLLKSVEAPARAVSLAVAAACLVMAMQNLTYDFVFVTTRKNFIAGQVELAQFLKRYLEQSNNEPVKIFFPYAAGYDLMELSAFLDYKGLPLPDNAQGQRVQVVFESPLRFPQNRCVDYRGDTCRHADLPGSNELIAELAADAIPDKEAAASDCEEVLFNYKPFVISPKSLPFFDSLQALAFVRRTHLPRRWLQVRIYRPCART